MDKMETTCIMCPMGCSLTITREGDEIIVKGNTCPRGKKYGTSEFTAPKRIVTSLVRLEGGGVVSCKTKDLIPKEMMGDILRELKKLKLMPHRIIVTQKTARAVLLSVRFQLYWLICIFGELVC